MKYILSYCIVVLCFLFKATSSYSQDQNKYYLETTDHGYTRHVGYICPHVQETNCNLTLAKYNGKLTDCSYCMKGQIYPERAVYLPKAFNRIYLFDYTQNKLDSINNEEMESVYTTEDQSVEITLIHEDISREKIEDIKAERISKNLATFSTIASGAAVALSTVGVFSSNARTKALASLIQKINTSNMLLSAKMVSVAQERERTVSSLYIMVCLRNLTDKEIQITNEDTGQSFHLLPGEHHFFVDFNSFSSRIRTEVLKSDEYHVNYLCFDSYNHLIRRKTVYEDGSCYVIQVEPFEREKHYLTEPENKSKEFHFFKIYKDNLKFERIASSTFADYKKMEVVEVPYKQQ